MPASPPPPPPKKASPKKAPPKGIPAPLPGRAKGKNTPRPVKTFAAAPLCGDGEGEKILIYGRSGMGKTTLAAQIPDAVFVPLDDGARKIHNPLTGESVQGLDQPVETFDDLRAVAQQALNFLPVGGTLVIDTITRAQPLAEQWVVENVKTDKGKTTTSIEGFGYGKGYRHVLDAMRLFLSDLDKLIRSGRNVILLGQLDQAIVANAAGDDYFCDVPKLTENKQGPIRTEVCEWSDHIFRLNYLDSEVIKTDDKARAGKIVGEMERAVFAGGSLHFIAKTRPIKGFTLPPVLSFSCPSDNSLWQYVLEGYRPDPE